MGTLAQAKGRLHSIALDRKTTLWVGATCVLASGFSAILLLSFAPFSPFCGPGCLEARLQTLVDPQGQVKAAEVNQARGLIRHELQFSAMDISAWLRQAALETQVSGALGPAAKSALATSYRLAPVDATLARWRLAFVFEHWDQLDSPLRAAAELEIQDLLVEPANIDILRQLEPTIRNPAGRLACQLLITSPLALGAAQSR